MKSFYGALFKLTCYGKHFNLNIFNKTVQRDFINNIYTCRLY